MTVTPDGLRVDELMPGVSPEDVIANTEPDVMFHPSLAKCIQSGPTFCKTS